MSRVEDHITYTWDERMEESFADELRCDAPHDCGLPVVFRTVMTCNSESYNHCAVWAGLHVRVKMADPSCLCASCLQPTSQCWRVIEI